MKFIATVAALAGAALALPADVQLFGRAATPINYVQNYNGANADFQYNEAAGTFTCSWNNPPDFVVGLGWTTGTERSISFSGTYTTNTGSYYAVYGWLNSPLTEYYVVESYSYNPCSTQGATTVGTLVSDGSTYTICTHTQVNQPSIVGTATFGQYFSVRQSMRTSGTVTLANHFSAWSKSGFQPGNYNYQVFAVEAFSGSGSASVSVAEGTSSVTPPTSTPPPSSSTPASSTKTTPPVTSSTPTGTCSAIYGQCGGIGWNGPTCCQSGTTCKELNPYYYQCLN